MQTTKKEKKNGLTDVKENNCKQKSNLYIERDILKSYVFC